MRSLLLVVLVLLPLAGCEPTRQLSGTTLFLASDGSIRAGSLTGATVCRAAKTNGISAGQIDEQRRKPLSSSSASPGVSRWSQADKIRRTGSTPTPTGQIDEPARRTISSSSASPGVSRWSQARGRETLRLPGMPEVRVNDCLPAAIAAQKTMQKNGVEARVLIVQWKERGRERSHAYTVFRYGKAYAYDKNYGSIPLASGTNWRNPRIVAMDANMRRGQFGQIVRAEFLED